MELKVPVAQAIRPTIGDMPPDERLADLRAVASAPVDYARHQTIRRERETVSDVLLLLDGWVGASVLVPSGQRQLVTVHLPGGLLGVAGLVRMTSPETLTALTSCTVAPVPLDRLRGLIDREPTVAMQLLLLAHEERLALTDTIALLGKCSARDRLVAFLLDLYDRLALAGQVVDESFDLCLTQEQIGDAIGLTSVHVNRTVRVLEREGLIARKGQRLRFLDLPALRRLTPLASRRARA